MTGRAALDDVVVATFVSPRSDGLSRRPCALSEALVACNAHDMTVVREACFSPPSDAGGFVTERRMCSH